MFIILLSSFLGVGYMYEGVICNHIMAIVNHVDVVWPFVVTTYPAV